jgi:FkbM family methyltransferase
MLKYLLRKLGFDQSFRIGGVELTLPAEHLLPRYSARHRRYDRFLPHLVRRLADGDVVVDVGANCGDTYAAMCAARPGATFLCVEPEAKFFELLASNAARVAAAHGAKPAILRSCLAGTSGVKKVLTGEGGTRRSVESDEGSAMRSLDDILAEAGQPKPRLIKSDVDGFDHDVMRSGATTIAAARPVLFFECQCDDEQQLEAYRQTMRMLEEMGYVSWTAFDNYGGVMLCDVSRSEVEQLVAYVWSQRAASATRTMYYLDILAGTREDASLMRGAVKDHLAG